MGWDSAETSEHKPQEGLQGPEDIHGHPLVFAVLIRAHRETSGSIGSKEAQAFLSSPSRGRNTVSRWHSDHTQPLGCRWRSIIVSKVLLLSSVWYCQCLSAPLSQGLPAGDDLRTNFHQSCWENLDSHSGSCQHCSFALLSCPSVPLPAVANEAVISKVSREPTGSWVEKLEKQVSLHSSPGMLLPPPLAPTCFCCLLLPWTILGRNPGN